MSEHGRTGLACEVRFQPTPATAVDSVSGRLWCTELIVAEEPCRRAIRFGAP
jgi:hypothetical protein